MGDDRAMWFQEWVANFCEATGGKYAAILVASKHHIVFELHATPAELGECVSRLVARASLPEFPTEVVNTLVRELMALRAERNARPPADYSAPPPAGPRCHWCGDTGLVAVPLPECVCQPADGPPYLRSHPDTRRVLADGTRSVGAVLTGAVLCDAPECDRGRDARDREARRDTTRPRATLSGYRRRFGGLDVVAMLRDHERELAEAARARRGAGDPATDAAVARIAARVDAQRRDAA